MTRLDTPEGRQRVRANAADAAPGSHASHHAASGVDGPLGFDPISQVIVELFAIKTPAVEWLEQAGPIVAELNEQSKKDIVL